MIEDSYTSLLCATEQDAFSSDLVWTPATPTCFMNRQLWLAINEVEARSENYLESELEKNKNKLLQGVLIYKTRNPTSEAFLNEMKLKKEQHHFVVGLSLLLGLDELQSYDLVCTYLFTEFRGSRRELTQTLGHGHHSQALLENLFDYYNEERLLLLRCLRIMLYGWLEGENPYKALFGKCLKKFLENNLEEKLLSQFYKVCNAPLPTKAHGPLMNRTQVTRWALQNLKEQTEVLELMLVYYNSFRMNLDTLLDLHVRFKSHKFGREQTYIHLVDEQMEKLIQKIGYLEVLILLKGMDIMHAFVSKDRNNLSEHAILCSKENVEKVDKVFTQLSSEPEKGPILLGWAVLLLIYTEVYKAKGDNKDNWSDTMSQVHQISNDAVKLGAFDFILELLNSEHFSRKSEEAFCVHFNVYAVISALLSLSHKKSLGNIKTLYKIGSKLLRWDIIADSVWEKGEPEGLQILYNMAKMSFPFEFEYFIQLNIALASAGHYSAQKVKASLHKIKSCTEGMDSNRPHDLQHSGEQGVGNLLTKKQQFHGAGQGSFIGASQVMRWDPEFNGWQYLISEIRDLLFQVSQGAGMVQTEHLVKVTMTMELVKEVLKSDPSSLPELLEIVNLGYQLILRFAVLNPAPLELLAHTVHCLMLAVPHFFSWVSNNLKQTGLLPFLTENIDHLTKIQSGEGISQGLYGYVLASTECSQGVYTMTLAMLDLVTQFVQVSSKEGNERDYLASLLFIIKEVFPRFHKWRYVDIGQRNSIGQKCLELFHQILTLAHMQEQHRLNKHKGPGLQDACVYSLLFTEAGHSLLEIVATGVDHIQMALAQQCSLTEGAGVDLLKLVELSLSLLNRLLLLKPPHLGQSPVEQALFSQPPGQQHQHIIATIAQYVYHQHSHKLPTMAIVLLKRLATLSPMSLLTCLGSDAEPIRDLFLMRLQAVSENIKLRAAILEMMSACVDYQPGLIEIFLNVQQPEDKATELGKLTASQSKMKLGRSSCLPILLNLIEVDKQCTYKCPLVLLCAALDFIHALWHSMREIPLALLREKPTFWPSVLAPLKVDLPHIQDNSEKSVQNLKLQTKVWAFALRIIALEICAMASKLDPVFKNTLQETFENDRILYWSKMVNKNMQMMSKASKSDLLASGQTVDEHHFLNLLLAWMKFIVMASCYKVSEVHLTSRNKSQLLDDLLGGIQAQYEAQGLTRIQLKLVAMYSELYFTLISTWGKELFDGQLLDSTISTNAVSPLIQKVKKLADTIHKTARSEIILPSVHIGLMSAVTSTLQQCGPRLEDPPILVSELLPTVCSVFLQNALYIPTLVEKTDQLKDGSLLPGSPHSIFGAHVKGLLTQTFLQQKASKKSESMDLTNVMKKVMLVVDTNVFICCLKFLEKIMKCNIPDYHGVLLVLPWVVTQELDYLKIRRYFINNQRVSSTTSKRAHIAIRFIYSHLNETDSKITGQTMKEAAEKTDLPLANNDDKIVHCCSQFQSKFPQNLLILLTRDVHLTNKAILNGINASNNETLLSRLGIPGLNSENTETSRTKDTPNSRKRTAQHLDVEKEDTVLSTDSCRGNTELKTNKPSGRSMPSTISLGPMPKKAKLPDKPQPTDAPVASKMSPKTSSLAQTEADKAVVMGKFESVWKLIHVMISQIEITLANGKSHANYDEAVALLKSLEPLLLALHNDFSRCLHIPPVKLLEHEADFSAFCAHLNTFYADLQNVCIDHSYPVQTVQLMRYFHHTGNRSLLFAGLARLARFVKDVGIKMQFLDGSHK